MNLSSGSDDCVDVVVIGAGLAGLASARYVIDHQQQWTRISDPLKVVVCEASFHLGGRVRTVWESELRGGSPPSHERWLRVVQRKDVLAASPSLGKVGDHNEGFEVGAEFLHGDSTLLSSLVTNYTASLSCSPRSSSSVSLPTAATSSSENCIKPLFAWAQGDGGPDDKTARHDGGFGLYYFGKEKRLVRFDQLPKDIEEMHDVLDGLGDHTGGEGSLYDYLKSKGISERGIALAEAGYANTLGGTLRSLSLPLTRRVEAFWEDDGHDNYITPLTLYESSIVPLSQGVNVIRGCAVTSIAHSARRDDDYPLTITCQRRRGEGSKTEIRAKYVVCAVPVSVLQYSRGCNSQLNGEQISFSPPLSPTKRNAIESMRIAAGSKIILKFSSPFWPVQLHGAICADSFIPEMWFSNSLREGLASSAPSPASTSGTLNQAYYVTCFSMSEASEMVQSHSDTDAVRKALQQLDDMFNKERQLQFGSLPLRSSMHVCPYEVFCGAVICDWKEVPFIRGAYTPFCVGEDRNARDVLAAPIYDNRVFFAGEATTYRSAITAHGAMHSGVRAAKELLSARQRCLFHSDALAEIRAEPVPAENDYCWAAAVGEAAALVQLSSTRARL